MEKSQVLKNEPLTAKIFILEILMTEGLKKFQPGQFLKIKPSLAPLDPLFPRPFTVHSWQEKKVSILYQIIGKGTQALSKLISGDEIEILAPLGNPYPQALEFPLALCGGGVGIAGFGFFLERLPLEFRRKTFLYYGARTEKDIVRLEYFRDLIEDIRISTEDGSLGSKGFITEVLEKDLQKGFIKSILACGPLPMLKVIKGFAERYSVKSYLSLETFMACGTGFCKGCVLRKKGGGFIHLCEEGPTLSAELVEF